jgi:predicted site-specific integrase-resolvase
MQVVRMVGIGRMTLLRWLKSGKLREPKRIGNGGVQARVWTDADVNRVRKYKQEHYRKGRGRKPKKQG